VEQSRAAARQAQDAWAMVLKSQQTLLNSMRPAGAPFAMAADQFEKLVQFQAEQQQRRRRLSRRSRPIRQAAGAAGSERPLAAGASGPR
jgi:hypothetical protein